MLSLFGKFEEKEILARFLPAFRALSRTHKRVVPWFIYHSPHREGASTRYQDALLPGPWPPWRRRALWENFWELTHKINWNLLERSEADARVANFPPPKDIPNKESFCIRNVPLQFADPLSPDSGVIGELRKFDSFVIITPDPYLCADALLHGCVPYQVIDRESRIAGLNLAFDFEVPDHEIFGGLNHKPFPSFNQAV